MRHDKTDWTKAADMLSRARVAIREDDESDADDGEAVLLDRIESLLTSWTERDPDTAAGAYFNDLLDMYMSYLVDRGYIEVDADEGEESDEEGE